MINRSKKILTGLFPVQRKKDQETVLHSLQAPSATRQEHQIPLAEKKRPKKRRIPFVALGFVLLFTSLCVLSLVGQQPLAWATVLSSSAPLRHAGSRSLQDATPTSAVGCIVTDCYGDPATPNSNGPFDWSLASDCKNTYDTQSGDHFCWNDGDFQWGTRDITCIKGKEPKNLVWPTNLPPPDGQIQATPENSNNPLSVTPNGQNTCTDNSTCYSDNASRNDDSGGPNGGPQIHDDIGGDDMICFNNVCLGQGGTSSNPNCSGQAFDKFGCTAMPNADGYFYNPTAFNPFADFELASATLHLDGNNGSTETPISNDQPTCGQDNRWSCPNDDNVYMALTVGTNTFANPFTGSPEQITDQISQSIQITAPHASRNIQYTEKEPEYVVGCYSTGSGSVFPCSDSQSGNIDEKTLQDDWLSGDVGTVKNGVEPHPGHIEETYADETHNLPSIVSLSSLTLALGYVVIMPALILIGYQLLWASWTFGRVAAMEMLARLLLSVVAVSVSYEVATTLIGLSNLASQAVVHLHIAMPYPTITLNGNSLTYTLDGETDPASFRGIVVPVTRWGCVMNKFMEVLEQKLITDGLSFLPFVGGFIKLAKGITDALMAIKDIGAFIELILSINFAAQVFVRVILVNYYILTTPVVFGCWSLPGGFGQRVLNQWFKGFCSILFTQAVQLFVLATLPLLMPNLPALPTDKFGFLVILLDQLPRIIILGAVIKVPNMLGTGATKAIAQAGSVSSGAIAAMGAAAYSVV